jgi:branched-chain amino acid aminotransferase
MATEVVNVNDISVRSSIAERLEKIALDTRIFVSMPYIRGIIPRVLAEKGKLEDRLSPDGVPRVHGIFRSDEIGVPAFDHGLLYGDAVFEGVLAVNGQLFQWREHLDRLYSSARQLCMRIPYSRTEFTEHVLGAVNDNTSLHDAVGYLRLVVTRGIGDLGIDPAKCAGCTVYCIVSKLQLYPEALYRRGLHLALSRRTRRSGPEIVDPRIKSCNYLNNILALLETSGQNGQETLMLSREGSVAEATTDNLFLAIRRQGWEDDPSRVTILTPSVNNCLEGITRTLVIGYAKSCGFRFEESPTIMPIDLIGENREVFLTGTGAGLIPVVYVDDHMVGDGSPGPITRKLADRLNLDFSDPEMGLRVDASRIELERYLASAAAIAPHAAPMTADFVSRAFEIIDSRDWDALQQIFCEDITYERPGYEPLVGFERVKKFYCEERVIASGTHFLEGVVMDAGQGACWGKFIGTHKNGSVIEERFADAYTFADGKIKKRRSYFFRPAI